MGNYENVLMDYDTTYDAIMHHAEVSEEEAQELTSLGSINENLMNRWFGVGGDTFSKFASTIEVEITNSIRFSDNSQEANRMLLYNNTGLDEDRADSIDASGQSGDESGD